MTLTGSDCRDHGLKCENPGWKAGVFAGGEVAEKFANTHSAHPELVKGPEPSAGGFDRPSLCGDVHKLVVSSRLSV